MKYPKVNFGQMEAALNLIGGINGLKRLLSGEYLFIAKKVFIPWKTINLGTGLKTSKHFNKALAAINCKITNTYPNYNDTDAALKLEITKSKSQISTVVVHKYEIGLSEHGLCSYFSFIERAKSIGLKVCPEELWPQLRLQYKDQPKGEHLYIATEPTIHDRAGMKTKLLSLGHDNDGLYMKKDDIDPYDNISGCPNSLIFILP